MLTRDDNSNRGYDRMAARIEKFGVGKDPETDEPDEVIEDVSWSDPDGHIVTDPEQIEKLEAAYVAQHGKSGV